jgi:hypothetical protein
MANIAPNLAHLAERINAEHQHALTAARTALEHARRAGELLAEAKAACGHGRWLPWLEANVKFSERTAQAYMRVAKNWLELEAKAQATADLTIEDALECLARPTERETGWRPNPRGWESWFAPEEELDPKTRKRYETLRLLRSDYAWDRTSWDDFRRYCLLLEKWLLLLRGEDRELTAEEIERANAEFDLCRANNERAK